MPSHSGNAVVSWVLRSSFSGLLEGSMLLLVVPGRRTGRRYRVPVQYARDGRSVWILVGDHEHKTWWRNLVDETPVQLWLRGTPVAGQARAIPGGTEPGLVGRGLRAYLTRFPRLARRWGVAGPDGALDAGRLAERARRSLMVRVQLPGDGAVPGVAAEGSRQAGPGVPGEEAGGTAGPAGMVRRHPLGAFYALTFALSWSYWVPVALTGGHLSHVPGLLGPAIAAVAVTGLTRGRPGLRDLGSRMVRWRVPLRWYLAAAAPLAVALATTAVLELAGADTAGWAAYGRMDGLPDVGLLGVVLGILLLNSYGEETGWRGYALPAFRRTHRRLQASMLVGVWWLLWHVPLFFLDTGFRGTLDPLVLPGFVLGLLAGAIVLTWVYEGSRSSVLLVALWHTAYNIGAGTRAGQGVVAVVVTASVILTALVVARGWARRERPTAAAAPPGSGAGSRP